MSGGPERQTSDGGAEWTIRPPRRGRLAPANDNAHPRGPEGRRRLFQTLLLAAATAAIVILARTMR